MAIFKLFGGDGHDLGTVSQIPSKNWHDFVHAILGHPVVIPVTRENFHAMDKDKRDKVKRVRFVTPAIFKSSHRVTAEAIGFSLVALDIDDAEHALPLYNDHNGIRASLSPFGFAVYTTARSTPTAPRLRVFVKVEGMMDPELYVRAVNTIAQRLDLPSVTKESYVMVQPMFLPSMFRDDTVELDHPLIVSDTEGRGLASSDLVADSSHATEGHATPPDGTVDDLDNLRPVMDEITAADVKDALSNLDPDCKMSEWIETGAALKHQFGEAGFELWNDWSEKGNKYTGEEDTQYRWSTLKPHPRGRAPVTIRSVLMRAREAGWDSTKATARCFDKLAQWLRTADPSEIVNNGIKRIASYPLISPMDKGSLINEFQVAMKRAGRTVSRTDLLKELKMTERAMNPLTKGDGPTDDKDLPKWARGICFVMATNEFYSYAVRRKMTADVLDATYSKHLMTPDTMDSGRPIVRPRDFLLNIHRIPCVDHYCYAPDRPEDVFPKIGQYEFINTYIANFPESNLDQMLEAGEMFWNHLIRLTGDKNYARVLMDFLAYQVQSPGAKIKWAVLIQGVEGAGKGFLADALQAVLGQGHLKMVNGTMLVGRQYNEWAKGSQVVIIDEVRVAGHNRYEVMNKLKPLITNEVIPIDEKYKGLETVPNCSNYLLFTNHRDALVLDDGDRRYFVIHSPLQTKRQLSQLGENYFSDLYRMITTQAGGLRAWFEEWRISPEFKPHAAAPETQHRAELIKSSASPLMQAVRDAISDSTNPLISQDLISLQRLRQQVDLDGALPNPATNTGLAAVLRDMGYADSPAKWHWGDESHQLWQPVDLPHSDIRFVAASRMNGGELL